MSLERILHKTKIFLAATLASTTIYAAEQSPIEIETKNGNWNQPVPVRLLYKSDTFKQGRDISKDKDGFLDTEVYLSGGKEDGKVGFAYTTTPLTNPKINAAVPNNTESRIYFLSEEGIRATKIKQTGIFMDKEGKISYEELTPKEETGSLLMTFGESLIKKIGESSEAYTESKTGGLISINLERVAERYCAKRTKEAGNKIRDASKSKLEISSISLDVNDRNLFTKKQIGRIISFQFSSPDGKDYPVSMAYHLHLQHDGSLGKEAFSNGGATEVGEIDAFTTPFIVSTKVDPSQASCKTDGLTQERGLFPYPGIWKTKNADSYVYVSQDGEMLQIQSDQVKGFAPLQMIMLLTPLNQGSLLNERIIGNKRITIPNVLATVEVENGREMKFEKDGKIIIQYEKMPELESPIMLRPTQYE